MNKAREESAKIFVHTYDTMTASYISTMLLAASEKIFHQINKRTDEAVLEFLKTGSDTVRIKLPGSTKRKQCVR